MTNKGLSLSKMIDDVPMLTVTEEDGKRLVREFVFQQIGRNGSLCDMDVMSQSTGTLRLLTLIPAIYFAINNEKTVLIDRDRQWYSPDAYKKSGKILRRVEV